ncbi:MAG TPA: nucleoside triphosphate pyrophosphohydrolase [Acidobacteriaceae bacterium]
MSDDVTSNPAIGALFARSAAIMQRLRSPEGCPWDREQTHDSIRKYTLEETYEVLDAIERRDWPNLCEELGDLLLQVLFYATMAEQAGDFSLADVLSGLNSKLVRRHPHVFGAEAAARAGNRAELLEPVEARSGTQAVLSNWRSIKEMEKKSHAEAEEVPSPLARVPRAQAALSEARELGSAAAGVGFDWPDAQGILDKLREEAAELEAELAKAGSPRAGQPHAEAHHVAEEYGDLLFTMANLGRHLALDPEITLRDANAKFRRRFQAMEAHGKPLQQLSAPELERLWAEAKSQELG